MKKAFQMLKIMMLTAKGSKAYFVFCAIVALCMPVVSSFFGSKAGEEDYLMSVFCLIYSLILPMMFGMLVLFTQITSTRFLYSVPQSREVMTRAIPLGAAGYCGTFTLLCVLMTGISLSVGMTDGNRMSDTLLFCAGGTLLILIAVSLFNGIGMGLLGIFFGVSTIVLLFLEEVPNSEFRTVFRYGFGVPTAVSAVLCVGAFALGTVLSLWIAEKSYHARSSKSMIDLFTGVLR